MNISKDLPGVGVNGDGVILLHGIFRTKRHMRRLGDFIEANGYQVLNLNYPSTRLPIEECAEHIHKEIAAYAGTICGRLHFVGYSMGGLVTRAYLHRYRPQNLGRVVMLGVPNHGSEVADFLKNWRFYKKLYGPAGQQLGTKLESREMLLGKVDYELGVIAGDRWIDPIGAFIIGVPNDGKVSIASTKVDGMKEHAVIHAAHTFFPDNRRAQEMTLSFLRHGRFASPAP